jgi:hypothetical protein
MTPLTPEQVQILTDLVANDGSLAVSTDLFHYDLILLWNHKLVQIAAVEVGKVVLYVTNAGRAALVVFQNGKLSTPVGDAG